MKPQPLLIDVPEQIQAPRLVLRVPRAGDGELILPSVLESLEQLKPWMPWASDDYDRDAAEQWCRKGAANFILREQFQFLILARDDGRHLGNVGAFAFHWDVPCGEIGYWLRTNETGRGYMSEAVNALTALCMEHLKLNRIDIHCDDTNVRSARVAERCGYTLEGVLRNHRRGTDGTLRHSRIYSRVAGA